MHLGGEHTAFQLTPLEDLADEAERIDLDAAYHVLPKVPANLLEAAVFGPRSYWDLRYKLVSKLFLSPLKDVGIPSSPRPAHRQIQRR
jgi:hypothetical protein